MEKTDLAKAIVAYSFRNGPIENIHAGRGAVSHIGDGSDVFVVDADGNKIPWNKVSRISQAEMKELMQTAVNRVYNVLTHEDDAEFQEEVVEFALTYTRQWDEPSTERTHERSQQSNQTVRGVPGTRRVGRGKREVVVFHR